MKIIIPLFYILLVSQAYAQKNFDYRKSDNFKPNSNYKEGYYYRFLAHKKNAGQNLSAQDYINLLNSFSQSKVSYVKENLRKDFEKTYPYDYQKYATPECPNPNICINVMVTCATEEDASNFIFSSEDFNTSINNALYGDSEVDSSKVVRSFNMKTGITAQGRDSGRNDKKVTVFNIQTDRIIEYMKKRQSGELTYEGYKTPNSVGDVLSELSRQAEWGCDFYIPTKFYDLQILDQDLPLKECKDILNRKANENDSKDRNQTTGSTSQ